MGLIVNFAVYGAAPKKYTNQTDPYWNAKHNYPTGATDVMVTLAVMIGRGETSFKACNDNFGDPSPGDTKHFAMLYTVDRGSGPVTYTVACEEGQMVVLPSDIPHGGYSAMAHRGGPNPENRIELRYAVYGAIQGSKDVTAIVKNLVANGTTSIHPSNSLFGDPAPGHGKHFGMYYSTEGIEISVACKEGQTFDLLRPPNLGGPGWA